MKTLRAITFSFVASLSLGGVLAQEAASPAASHIQATEELMDKLRLEEFLEKSLESNLQLQIQQNPQLTQFEDVMRAFFQKYLNWDSIKPEMVQIYAGNFTEAEIRDMLSFYETPTGQKAITLLPTLFEKGASLGQKRVRDNIEELQEAIAKRAEELAQQEDDAQKETQPSKPPEDRF